MVAHYFWADPEHVSQVTDLSIFMSFGPTLSVQNGICRLNCMILYECGFIATVTV